MIAEKDKAEKNTSQADIIILTSLDILFNEKKKQESTHRADQRENCKNRRDECSTKHDASDFCDKALDDRRALDDKGNSDDSNGQRHNFGGNTGQIHAIKQGANIRAHGISTGSASQNSRRHNNRNTARPLDKTIHDKTSNKVQNRTSKPHGLLLKFKNYHNEI